jgi:hypothetical protein
MILSTVNLTDIMGMVQTIHGLDWTVLMDKFVILKTKNDKLGYRYYIYTQVLTGAIYRVITSYDPSEIDEITLAVNKYIKKNNVNESCVVGRDYIWVNMLYE